MSLTTKLASFLDPQLALLLIEFAEKQDGADSSELRLLKLKALEATLLVDRYEASGGSSEKASQMRQVAAQPNAKSDPNLLYAAGQYEKALDALKSHPNAWGQYAAYIVSGRFNDAFASLSEIGKAIDAVNTESSGDSALEQLNSRAWFLHWALFSLFRVDGGLERLEELFFQSTCLTSIQSVCPWLLRYLAVAVVIKPKGHKLVEELVRTIKQEEYEYSDAVTSFLSSLYCRYESLQSLGAQRAACEKLLAQDYFCAPLASRFSDACNRMIIEVYMKTHARVSVSHISTSLGLSASQVQELLRQNNASPGDSQDIFDVKHQKNSLAHQLSEKAQSFEHRGSQALTHAEERMGA